VRSPLPPALNIIALEARATALSLHSFFFFMGQTFGPIAYGFGIQNVG
jgi:MFS transporter, DHA1 family, inner membrane transport protein